MEAKLKFGVQRSLMLLASAAIVAGCATEPAPVEDRSLVEPVPVTTKAGEGPYRVVRGDTLYAIAFKRGLDYRDVAAWNGIAPPYRILVGQELRFAPPSAGPRTAVAPGVPSTSSTPTSTAATASRSPSATAATTGPAVVATSKSGGLFEDVPSQFSPPAHAAPDAASASTSTQGRPTAAAPAESATADTDEKPPEPKAAAAMSTGTSATVPVAAPTPGAVSGVASTSTTAASSAAPAVVSPKPAPPQEPAPAPAKPANDAAVANAGGIGWHWPSTGKLLGGFVGGDQTKQGIDIGGNEGDPVRAAADGEVVYSGNGLIGYGELIIIKHNASFLSAYGHNRKRLVQEGDKVRAGQQIAEMGSSASARDELHFEIRKNGKPVNPMDYLPAR